MGIDMVQNNCIVTAGVNESTPPIGCVRLWSIPSVKAGDGSRDNDTPKFLAELADHLGPVNTTRFSPCGRYLATASDRQIIIYKAESKDTWGELGEKKDTWGNVIGVKSLERLRFQPSLTEIYDLRWSPDSSHIVAGALDNKAEIIRLSSRHATSLTGHTNYVQGVAWDPCNKMVVTQSSDRTCRVHSIKYSGPRANINTCGNSVIKKIISIGVGVDENVDNQAQNGDGEVSTEALNEAPTTPAPIKPTAMKATVDNRDKGRNLFADSTVPCFFRRPTFTPDGQLFIAPTGVYKHTEDIIKQLDPTVEVSPKSFCTHIFSRNQMTAPIASLTGLEDPSVAVKCNPVLYKMKDYDGDIQTPMVPGKYRVVFAVTTTNGVYIYDTQHHYPIAKIAGIHYACVNDACWSEDGQMLAVCSSDGYVSFARFPGNILGEPVDPVDIPDVMRQVPVIDEDVNDGIEADGENGEVSTDADRIVDVAKEQVNVSNSGMTQNTVTNVPLVKKKRIAPIFTSQSSGSRPTGSSQPSSSTAALGNSGGSVDDAINLVHEESPSLTHEKDKPHVPEVRKKQRITPEIVTDAIDSNPPSSQTD